MEVPVQWLCFIIILAATFLFELYIQSVPQHFEGFFPSYGHSLPRIRNDSVAATKGEIKSVAKVEIGLARARAAVKEAAINSRKNQSSDNSVYRNEAVFNRSYEEMEKRLKVFVYREGYPPLVHYGYPIDIYSTEGFFINQMDISDNPFLTEDPEEAHLFFIPFSITMLIEYVYKTDIRRCRMHCSKKGVMADYIDVISAKYRFWNRSRGADHFFLACHDWAPQISTSNKDLHKNAIRVLCNANSSEGFDLRRDVTLMEMKLMRDESLRTFGGRPYNERDVLAFFTGGRNHGWVRPLLMQHWANSSYKDIVVLEQLPPGKDEFHTVYNEYLQRSKFCLCPSGYEVASPRIVEAIYSGCVPVIISPGYVLPASEVLRWEAFSIRMDPQEIPRLKEILDSVSESRYRELQNAVLRVQKHFRVNYPPVRHDMFHMLLHSAWLRRLNFQIHEHEHRHPSPPPSPSL